MPQVVPQNMPRGRFITFEGGEGAGKSTQVRLLAEALRAPGLDVVETREPGGSEGAEQIRALLVRGATGRWDVTTEALLHFAARRDHLLRRVWPALEAGRWVISDRFADSTLAYQGLGQGLERAVYDQLYAIAVGDFRPDLTFILDLPVEEGLRRAEARQDGENRYETMGLEFHRRIQKAFRAIAEAEPERCKVIDATGGIEAIQQEIRSRLKATFGAELP